MRFASSREPHWKLPQEDPITHDSEPLSHGLTQLLHADLHRLDVPERIKYKLCMTMHRCAGARTALLHSIWRYTGHQSLRPHHDSIFVRLPAINWQCRHIGGPHIAWAFAVAGQSTWNSLPTRLRDPSSSFAVFARLLKTFLFSEYLCYVVYPAH